MTIVEIILGSLFVFGCIMKAGDIPGGSTLLSFSSLLLAMIYFFFSYFIFNKKRLRHIFRNSTYTNTNVFKILTSVFTGWALSPFIIGVHFIILHWPEGRINLIIGSIWIAIIIVILICGRARHKEFVMSSIKHVLIIIAIGCFAMLLHQFGY